MAGAGQGRDVGPDRRRHQLAAAKNSGEVTAFLDVESRSALRVPMMRRHFRTSGSWVVLDQSALAYPRSKKPEPPQFTAGVPTWC